MTQEPHETRSSMMILVVVLIATMMNIPHLKLSGGIISWKKFPRTGKGLRRSRAVNEESRRSERR